MGDGVAGHKVKEVMTKRGYSGNMNSTSNNTGVNWY